MQEGKVQGADITAEDKLATANEEDEERTEQQKTPTTAAEGMLSDTTEHANN